MRSHTHAGASSPASAGAWARDHDEIRAFLDAARERVSIEQLAREAGMTLRRSGRSYRAPCPFHGGKNPNLAVNPARQFFYCFKCGATGDVIDFVRDHPHFTAGSFGEVLTYLADRSGVARPTRTAGGADAQADAAARAGRAHRAFALRYVTQYLRAARLRFRDTFDAACASLNRPATALGPGPGGARPAVSTAAFCTWIAAHGTGLHLAAPDGLGILSQNLQRHVAPDGWDAFRELGFVQFDGTPGSAVARSTMRDLMPPGLVWPVVDHGTAAGFVALSAEGVVTWASQAVGWSIPARSALAVPAALESDPADPDTLMRRGRRRAPGGEDVYDLGAQDEASAPILYASVRDYWALGPVLHPIAVDAGADAAAGREAGDAGEAGTAAEEASARPPIVPVASWAAGFAAGSAPRTELARRHASVAATGLASAPLGVVSPAGPAPLWASAECLPWIGGVFDPVTQAVQHPLEALLATLPAAARDAALDAAIARLDDSGDALVLRGWRATLGAPSDTAPATALGGPAADPATAGP